MKGIYSKAIFLMVFFFIFFSFCKKEDRIPYVYVNYRLHLNNPDLIDLQTAGNYIYLTGGVKGIIVYTLYPGEYKAYERNCPYKPFSENAFVKVDSTETLLVCLSCDSRFSIIDGSVVKGPASLPLLQYQTYVENNILHIFNEYYY